MNEKYRPLIKALISRLRFSEGVKVGKRVVPGTPLIPPEVWGFDLHGITKGKRDVKLIQAVWGELVYGCVETNDLEAEGYTPRSWCMERLGCHIPEAMATNLDRLFCYLLLLAARTTGSVVSVHGEDVTVDVDGVSLSSGSRATVTPGFSPRAFLFEESHSKVSVTGTVLRPLYDFIEAKKDRTEASECKLVLTFLLERMGAKRLNDAIYQSYKYVTKRVRQVEPLPSTLEVEALLFGEDKRPPVIALYKRLVPACISRREFITRIGYGSDGVSYNESTRYRLLYAYRDLLKKKGIMSC